MAIEEMTGAKVQAKTHWSRCAYKSLNMFEHSVKCCTSFRSRASTLLLELACQKAGQTLFELDLAAYGIGGLERPVSSHSKSIEPDEPFAKYLGPAGRRRREEALCRDYWCACLFCIQWHLQRRAPFIHNTS